jgi:hypothetical protein
MKPPSMCTFRKIRAYRSQDLEKAREKMRAAEGLVKALCATEGPLAMGDALFIEVQLANKAGVIVAPVVWETVVARSYHEALEKGDYEVAADMLDTNSSSPTGIFVNQVCGVCSPDW